MNTYTGNTTVSAGNLEIGDISHPAASVLGDVTIGGAGTLSGHGTVGGNIDNSLGGVVAPGGTIGILTVGGNYTQGASSDLTIEVNPNAASKLAVGGSASLNGKLNLVYDPGVYHSATYTILSATGGVSGQFTSIDATGAPALLQQSLLYGSNAVDLQLANYTVRSTNSGVLAAATSVAIDNARRATETILDHLGRVTGGLAKDEVLHDSSGSMLGSAVSGTARHYGGWFTATGDFSTTGSDGAAPGYSSRTGGFLTGIDRPVGSGVLGLAAGYDHSDLTENTANTGEIQSLRLAVYGTRPAGPVVFDASLAYAHDWLKTKRPIASIGIAGESHAGNEIDGAVQAGLPLGWNQMRIVPAIGLTLEHADETGFAETGGSGFDLTAASHQTTTVDPYAGVAVSRLFSVAEGTTILPSFGLRYARIVAGDSRSVLVTTVSGASFPATGLSPSKNRLETELGVSVRAGSCLTLFAQYGAALPVGSLMATDVDAGLRITF